MVPTEKDYYTHPMQVFRRRRALHHPPDCCASIAGTSAYDIFCTVQDNLLVVCQWTKDALALPSGVMFNIYELLNEPHLYPGPHPDALEYLQTVYAALPDGCIAFVHREQLCRLVVQSLLENKSRVWKIHRDKSVAAHRILGDSSIAAAGDDAQWVVFYSSERCITVFDWRSGEEVGSITVPLQGLKLLMGECPAIDDMSVVGLVREREVGWLKEVDWHALEGEDNVFAQGSFEIPLNKNCEVVLRSRDKRTYVVIMGTVAAEKSLLKDFWVSRFEDGGQKMWDGRLLLSSQFHYPDLRENGRVIAAKQGISCRRAPSMCASRRQKLWIELVESGTKVTLSPWYDRGVWQDATVIWSRRAYDGGYALLALKAATWSTTEKDVVELVKIVKREGSSQRVLLKRWIASTPTDWCVVADHFVMAKRHSSGRICAYHFDAFCGRVQGVWQCRGIVPRGFKMAFRESHMNRKRRVCACGGHTNAEV